MKLRFRRNRGPMIPDGTTHVLEHLPAFLLEPDYTGGQGTWAIQTLANYLNGTPDGNLPGPDGPATLSEFALAAFAVQALGRPVSLTRFEVEIEDPDGGPASIEPAFYLAG